MDTPQLIVVGLDGSKVDRMCAGIRDDAAWSLQAASWSSAAWAAFVDLLLGSVRHQCAQHAACPVVIVPAPSHR